MSNIKLAPLLERPFSDFNRIKNNKKPSNPGFLFKFLPEYEPSLSLVRRLFAINLLLSLEIFLTNAFIIEMLR